jgi:pimeloyl-ACP methyl ester carboxylesterase
VPGSIATLEQVTLGGSQQWITIRGKNVHNPVLLFLAGGPGSSELSSTRSFLGALEDHFVVVNWDQPGAGKSYDAVQIATLTPQRYVSDAHQLVHQLPTRFHQDKLYLMGDSWGTIPGTLLV